MKCFFLSMLLLWAFQPCLFAQLAEPEFNLERIIENRSELDDDADYTPLIEDLAILNDSPLDLNEVTAEDLEVFEFLNDQQIENILAYRKRSGNFVSIYELQSIEGLEMEDVENLLLWVCVSMQKKDKITPWRRAWKYKRQQLLMRTQWVGEEQAGYMSKKGEQVSNYPGDKYKLYAKYKMYYKQQIKFGLTAEKDPGEQFFEGNQKKGFDFYSAYVQIRKRGIVDHLVIGDFDCKMGQGLICSNGMSLGKSSMVMAIRQKGQGLKAYGSADENNFKRGIGTTVKLGKWTTTAFLSYKKIDANLLTDSAKQVNSFSAFQSTGSHATAAEIQDQKSIGESILGLNLNYEFKNARIGANYMAYRYSLPMNRSLKTYNRYEFNGQENQNASIDYFLNFNHLQFFGETAISENGGKAILNGMTVEANYRLRFSCLHRIYDKEYQAVYGKAFGEGSLNANETGLFFGLEFLPVKKMSINAYFDVFKSDWFRYQVSAPSQGHEFFGQINYQLTRNSILTFKLHVENKAKDYVVGQLIKTANYEKTSYRLNYDYHPIENISCRNRLEWLVIDQPYASSKKGFVIFQDINYAFRRIPIKASVHYAIFDTDDWESRIYAYEQDILYGFSIPAYYMKGRRSCLTLKYAMTPKCSLWLRAAQTTYENLSTIGSGDAEIKGSTKTDFKIQLQFKF